MDTQLIVRLIVSIVAVINSACAMAGQPLLDLGEDQITGVVNVVVLVAAWVWGFWKNNNFTQAAKDAQKLLEEEKGK